jgi:hypothetical protein
MSIHAGKLLTEEHCRSCHNEMEATHLLEWTFGANHWSPSVFYPINTSNRNRDYRAQDAVFSH